MCGNPLEALSPVVGIFGAAGRQRKALREQERVQRENIAAQERTAANARKAETNKTRTPNFNAIFDRNTVTAGVSSTVLTGAGGVSNGLTLARNSLLGS